MAFNLQLQPTPKRSPYVEQLLQPTEIQAFSKGPQIQEAILKALSKGVGGYFEGRERRRSEGVRDRLRDVIAEIPTRGPSGWVNPDEALRLEGQFAQLSPETKLRGRVPVGQDILAAARAGPPPDRSMDQAMFPSIAGELAPTDAEIRQARLSQAMQPGGSLERYDPAGGPVVPMTAFRPDTAVLDDPTQLRGKEALFSAIATDPQLQSLVGSDIDTLTQVMMADLLQKAPGQYLTPAEKKTYGYGPTDVVWQTPGEPPQVVKSVTQKVPDYVEYWDNKTGDSLGLVEKGSPEEAQLVSTKGVTGGRPDKPLQIVRAMHAAGVPEDSAQWKETLNNFITSAAKGAGNTVIQMYETADNAFNVALAKGQAKQLLDLEAAAGASQELLYQLELMSTIPTPDEGILSNFHHVVRKWAHDTGIPMSAEDVTKIRNVEQFKSTFTNLLAAKLATQSGPQTETDAQRMGDSLAKLTNMHDANKFIINMSIALETRKIEQASFWSAYNAKHGNIRGVAAEWEAHKEKTPLFTYNYNTGVHMFYPQWKDDIRADNAAAQNLEWDGKTYANNDDGLEKLWQDQHLKYMTTARQ
jgi:hypothetical protein